MSKRKHGYKLHPGFQAGTWKWAPRKGVSCPPIGRPRDVIAEQAALRKAERKAAKARRRGSAIPPKESTT